MTINVPPRWSTLSRLEHVCSLSGGGGGCNAIFSVSVKIILLSLHNAAMCVLVHNGETVPGLC